MAFDLYDGGAGEYDNEVFTASGNFTVPDNVYRVWITGCGAGGAGGGGTTTISGSYDHGATGGGSGEHVFRRPVDVTPGDVIAVTIGAGGTGPSGGSANPGTDGPDGGYTSFGSYVYLDGGKGGKGAYTLGSAAGRNGGLGGGGGYAGYYDISYAFTNPPRAAANRHVGGASAKCIGVYSVTTNNIWPWQTERKSQTMHGSYYDGGQDGNGFSTFNISSGTGGAGSYWGTGGEGAHYLNASTYPATNGGTGAGGGGGVCSSYGSSSYSAGDGGDGYMIVDWKV